MVGGSGLWWWVVDGQGGGILSGLCDDGEEYVVVTGFDGIRGRHDKEDEKEELRAFLRRMWENAGRRGDAAIVLFDG